MAGVDALGNTTGEVVERGPVAVGKRTFNAWTTGFLASLRLQSPLLFSPNAHLPTLPSQPTFESPQSRQILQSQTTSLNRHGPYQGI